LLTLYRREPHGGMFQHRQLSYSKGRTRHLMRCVLHNMLLALGLPSQHHCHHCSPVAFAHFASQVVLQIVHTRPSSPCAPCQEVRCRTSALPGHPHSHPQPGGSNRRSCIQNTDQQAIRCHSAAARMHANDYHATTTCT
jgi:hypothetical protein